MNGLLVLAATLAMTWLPAGAQARADSPAAAERTRLDSWMGDLAPRLARTPLNRIAMPGSHDAGSWSITARSGQCRTGYISDLARTFHMSPFSARLDVRGGDVQGGDRHGVRDVHRDSIVGDLLDRRP